MTGVVVLSAAHRARMAKELQRLEGDPPPSAASNTTAPCWDEPGHSPLVRFLACSHLLVAVASRPGACTTRCTCSTRVSRSGRLIRCDAVRSSTAPCSLAACVLCSPFSPCPEVRGPADTPYEDGAFKLEVQVPHRYPFEPPRVRFLTPIHHPNIDSGGTICLDTLNMPPKGSWNPSSNLCSVLTTIQQLMAEPNPDDGLSADVTQQFKSNRAAFDMQARSMTKQYAMSGHAISPTAADAATPAPTGSASAIAAALPIASTAAAPLPSLPTADLTAVTPPTPVIPPVASLAADKPLVSSSASKRSSEDLTSSTAAEDQPPSAKKQRRGEEALLTHEEALLTHAAQTKESASSETTAS